MLDPTVAEASMASSGEEGVDGGVVPLWSPARVWAGLIRKPRLLLAAAREPAAAHAIHRGFLVLLVVVLAASALQDLVLAGWLLVRVGPLIGLQAALRFIQEAVGATFIAYVVAWGLLWLTAPSPQKPHAAIRGALVAMPVALMAIAQSLAAPIWWSRMGSLHLVGLVWAVVLLAIAIREQRRDTPAGEVAVADAPWLRRSLALAMGVAISMQLVLLWTNRVALAPASQFDTVGELPTITPQGARGPSVGTRLGEAPGKFILVEVWATWCGPCRQSLPHVSAFAAAHADMAVVLVNIDDASRAASLVGKLPFVPSNVVLAYDTTRYADRVGVTTLPTFAVYDQGGQLVDVWSGFDRTRLEHNLSGGPTR